MMARWMSQPDVAGSARAGRRRTHATDLRGAALALALLVGCGGGAPAPADPDTRHTPCAHCTMIVSDPRTAAQVVAPGEEPAFFDDLGCLSDWLRDRRAPLAAHAMIYVADHRTGAWVPADEAVFTRVADLQTPMGSGLVAHATAASRDQDELGGRGAVVPPGDVLHGRWTRDAAR